MRKKTVYIIVFGFFCFFMLYVFLTLTIFPFLGYFFMEFIIFIFIIFILLWIFQPKEKLSRADRKIYAMKRISPISEKDRKIGVFFLTCSFAVVVIVSILSIFGYGSNTLLIFSFFMWVMFVCLCIIYIVIKHKKQIFMAKIIKKYANTLLNGSHPSMFFMLKTEEIIELGVNEEQYKKYKIGDIVEVEHKGYLVYKIQRVNKK